MPREAANHTGTRFGRLLVVARAGSRGRSPAWRCLCDCGREKIVSSNCLVSGHVASCGCLRGEKLSGRMIDHTGTRFGRLVAVSRCPDRGRARRLAWLCRCDCGKEVQVSANSLVFGRTVSCGCFRRDRTCLPPGEGSFNRNYASYQASAKKRGLAFTLTKDQFRDLTRRPCWYCGSPPREHRHSHRRTGGHVGSGVDRIDNTEGYVPGNVRACCSICNRAKRELSEVEFLDWLEQVAHYWSNTHAAPAI